MNGISEKSVSVSFESDFSHIINGKKATSNEYRDVVNPANKQPFASVPVATREQLEEAIDAADRALPAWAATPFEKRRAAVASLGRLIAQWRHELMALLTKETGKPIITHSGWEIGAAELYFYGISAQSLPDEVVVDDEERTVITRYVPLGVIAAIVPWNFPVLVMSWKVAPALLAGNTVVLKPSPLVPLFNLKFVELAQQVLPPGVLNIVSEDGSLGPMLTTHPKIAKIAFTGSTETGKRIMKSAAEGIKRVTLELGGNDPAIVLPDVDCKKVAPDVFWCAYNNAGQLCGAAKRVYIHEDIYDEMCAELVAFAKTVKVGDGLDPKTDMGPVQNQPGYEKVKGYFDDCKKHGMKFLIGGEIDEDAPGWFVPPTLVDNPPDDSRIVREEPFGPIVPLLKWRDEEEVIRRANDSEYGLCASIWCRDTDRGNRIAERMQAGTAWVNDFVNLHPNAPFGGHKMSGLGHENGREGLVSYTNTQVIFRNKKSKY